MTTFLLIRHAHTDITGSGLAGRQAGHSLSDAGRAQAQQLAEFLQSVSLDAIYSSPLARAWETAHSIAEPHQLEVKAESAFNELDYGCWTGQSFEALQSDPRWQRWNQLRSLSQPPSGEMMLRAQARAVEAIYDLHRRFETATIAIVSHADIIKAILAHLLGVPLDLFGRIEIAPASVSIARLYDADVSVQCVNRTGKSIL